MDNEQLKTRYRVYNFIVWFKQTYDGNSPSIEEIREAVELKSKSPVHGHLDNLVEEGLLYRHDDIDPRTARCIMVTGGKWSAENDTSG